MREAVGTSMLFYLIIPIIFLIIFFMAFIMNYASAYRAANFVITEIENCQGYINEGECIDSDSVSHDRTWITQTIKEKYHYITPNMEPNTNGIITPICIPNGMSNSNGGVVYRVELPVEFDVPLLGELRWMIVKAETKTIYNRDC